MARVSVRRLLLAGLVISSTALVAACGGSGGSDSAASDPGSASYDPAKTTLHDAGLAVCSEQQKVAVGGLEEGGADGPTATRGFYVAKDCKGEKKTPNTVVVM